MPRWPFLRAILTLLLAAGLVLGGASFGTSPASAAAPPPADCPHHAELVAEHSADHDGKQHDHGSKLGGCHCPLMTCSGWTLAPVALDLLPFDPTAAPLQPAALAAFIPHPPGVPLQPPRA